MLGPVRTSSYSTYRHRILILKYWNDDIAKNRFLYFYSSRDSTSSEIQKMTRKEVIGVRAVYPDFLV